MYACGAGGATKSPRRCKWSAGRLFRLGRSRAGALPRSLLQSRGWGPSAARRGRGGRLSPGRGPVEGRGFKLFLEMGGRDRPAKIAISGSSWARRPTPCKKTGRSKNRPGPGRPTPAVKGLKAQPWPPLVCRKRTRLLSRYLAATRARPRRLCGNARVHPAHESPPGGPAVHRRRLLEQARRDL